MIKFSQSEIAAPVIPVVLAGGAGSRLWPLSRQRMPKPFLPLLANGRTLFQETLMRLQGLPDPIVVCNDAHRFLALDQLKALDIQPLSLIAEPIGRNTAPALTLAALWVLDQRQDATMLMLPADHLIRDVKAFRHGVNRAVKLAAQGQLVAFGVVPQAPHTGYGYIRRGKGSAVQAFVEKPDAVTAQRYVASGEYFWNSGMFVITASRWLEEASAHCPQILAACQAAFRGGRRQAPFFFPQGAAFAACPSDSVDYAVAEKTQRAAVVPLNARWSDIGDWRALGEALPPDALGNAIRGDVVAQDAQGSLLWAQRRLLVTLGLRDLIVVETPDAVLVAQKERAQEVKGVFERLLASQRPECVDHVQVSNKPWGAYRVLDKGDGFQVKRITVKPGDVLSLQSHQHRSEHWVVVQGTAVVTRNDDVLTLQANESVYIPARTKHRLGNPGPGALELIEVQLGGYLGEDDIVRYEDRYDRQANPT